MLLKHASYLRNSKQSPKQRYDSSNSSNSDHNVTKDNGDNDEMKDNTRPEWWILFNAIENIFYKPSHNQLLSDKEWERILKNLNIIKSLQFSQMAIP